jgi:hypothetical protein
MTLLDASFVVLCAIVVAQFLALQAVFDTVREHVGRRTNDDASADDPALAAGKPAPPFSFQVLDEQTAFTEQDLLGRTTMLLFVTVIDARRLGDRVVHSILYGLSGQCDERLNIAVEGSTADCRWFRDHYRLDDFYKDKVRLLVAQDVGIRYWLGITDMPSCAVFNDDGTLKKVGAPVLEDADTEPGMDDERFASAR